MNNDLISREALKKDFEERNKACDKWIANAKDEETKIRADATKHFICEVIMTIDNAPNVEAFTKEDMAGAYNEGYACCGRESKRPQGEWVKIFENPFTNGYVCPFCGHKIQVTEQFLPKVTECEVCGADMRGAE